MAIVLWKLASSKPLPNGVSELLCVKVREDFNSVEKVDLTKIVNVLIVECWKSSTFSNQSDTFIFHGRCKTVQLQQKLVSNALVWDFSVLKHKIIYSFLHHYERVNKGDDYWLIIWWNSRLLSNAHTEWPAEK